MSAGKLSKQCRQFLLIRQQKPSRDREFFCKPSKVLTQLLDWCQLEDISPGRPSGNNYIITREGINAVEHWLSEHEQPPLAGKYQDKDRRQVAKFDDNEKNAAIKPKDSLALVAVCEPSLIAAIQQFYRDSTQPLNQINIELVVEQLDLGRFEQLVVIENRDSFNDWYRYAENIDPGDCELKPLVVYRGDGGDAKACKALRLRWQAERKGCPMIYFGDFDLAGLSFATDGDYQQLLLPHLVWLTGALKEQHFEQSETWRLRDLHHRCPEHWLPLLELITRRKAGLRQQWMFDCSLRLYPNSG